MLYSVRYISKNKFWFIIGLFVILFLSSYTAWRTLEFWRMREALPMVLLTSVGYIFSYLIISKLTIFPRVEYSGIILTVVSFTFLLIIGILALGRLYYSRSFLALAYILNIIWFLAGYSYRKKRLKFAFVSFDKDCELLKLKGIECFTLDRLYKDLDVDGIVIPSTEDLPSEWKEYIVSQTLKGIPIYTIPNIYENIFGMIPIKYFYGRLIENQAQSTIYRFFKRTFDILLLIISIPIIFPICIIIAILIKLDSDGPVLFKQKRVGQGEKIFEVIKFRTMYKDSEKDGPKFALKDDPRITRIGRILRRLHLDELPQFWNVLKGEMSFVGPRPEQVDFVEEFKKKIPYYSLRHLAKPGITGWAQVHYGYAAGLEETYQKLEYDLYYVKNMSIWLDILIIIKTIKLLVSSILR